MSGDALAEVPDAPHPSSDQPTFNMLKGVRVLSLTHFLQGPSASQMLGDLGADVIKVESPAGAFERHWSAPDVYFNGESVFFLLGNGSQRSVSIDLRTPEGKEVLWDLIDSADVLIESFRPGVLDRLGFGWKQLQERKPSLIYVALSGYGPDGPYRLRAGQDVLIQGLSGLALLNGRRNDLPVPAGASLVDQHAAALATIGVLAALHERLRTGVGCRVDSSLLSAALDLQLEPIGYYLNGAGYPERSETGVSARYYKAPYGVFETADKVVCLSLNPLDRLARTFDDPSLVDLEGGDGFANRDVVNARIAAHLATKTMDEWLPSFERDQVWWAPVNDYDAVVADPQVEWNDSIISVEHPTAGAFRTLSNPLRFDGQAPVRRSPPPALGEHTVEILANLGYRPEAIDELVGKKIVKAAEERVD